MPKRLTRNLKRSTPAPHVNGVLNTSRPTPRRPRGAWSAPTRPCRIGWSRKCGWHKRYGQRQRMAAGLHCGLQPARFAVVPKDLSDAYLAYPGTSAERVRILSVQVTRTLSKNLSCQYENQLLQIKTTGTGLGLRGAKVTVHEYFDGRKELLWKKRWYGVIRGANPLRAIRGETCLSVGLPTMGGTQFCSKGNSG